MKIKINTGKHQCWSILLIKLQVCNFIQKQPTGSSSVKKVFWGVLTWKFEVLWTFSSEIKRSTIESEATLTNIVTLLKTCLFFSDIEVFWILIGRTISNILLKQVSRKHLPGIFLIYWGFLLWYFFALWENDGDHTYL